jgi:hypothetical protein
MNLTSGASTERVEVSTHMPTAIRGLMIAAGAAACVLVVVELGRALWPPSFLTVFIGIIVAGGIGVGSAFVAGGLLSPNIRWSFSPGQVHIETELFGRSESHTFAKHAFESIAILEVSNDSGANTFQLACSLAEPARSGPLFPKHRTPLSILAFVLSPARTLRDPRYLLTTLHSPDFHSRESAQAALALLRA